MERESEVFTPPYLRKGRGGGVSNVAEREGEEGCCLVKTEKGVLVRKEGKKEEKMIHWSWEEDRETVFLVERERKEKKRRNRVSTSGKWKGGKKAVRLASRTKRDVLYPVPSE